MARESKTDDDGVPPVVVPCYIERMPDFFWFNVVMYLVWGNDASAMHPTSKAIRDRTVSGWQRITIWGTLGDTQGVRRGVAGVCELSEAIGHLTNLTVLDIRGTALTGPPLHETIRLLSPLTKLEELNLKSHSLGGIISVDIGVFTNLKKLILPHMSLRGKCFKVPVCFADTNLIFVRRRIA